MKINKFFFRLILIEKCGNNNSNNLSNFHFVIQSNKPFFVKHFCRSDFSRECYLHSFHTLSVIRIQFLQNRQFNFDGLFQSIMIHSNRFHFNFSYFTSFECEINSNTLVIWLISFCFHFVVVCIVSVGAIYAISHCYLLHFLNSILNLRF